MAPYYTMSTNASWIYNTNINDDTMAAANVAAEETAKWTQSTGNCAIDRFQGPLINLIIQFINTT